MANQIKIERSKVYGILCIANTVLAVIVAIVKVIVQEIPLAAGWLLIAVVWLINAKWQLATPYMQISENELILFIAPVRKPRRIAFRQIESVDLKSRQQAVLKLNNGKKIKFSWWLVDKKDRNSLRAKLEQIVVAKKGADK